MNANGIAGRKPYGITTRMLQLVGWKSLEADRLIGIGNDIGVDGANVNFTDTDIAQLEIR